MRGEESESRDGGGESQERQIKKARYITQDKNAKRTADNSYLYLFEVK